MTVVLPKPAAMLKPGGTARFESVRSALQRLVTVKVLVTGTPNMVVPKLNEAPSAMSPTPVSETAISGAAGGVTSANELPRRNSSKEVPVVPGPA